ncbi:MAG: hypothetical protein D6788_00245 [Planctomycetota bacterium]|nr:MAG: hypothetical protein D6788_00245 [Planctomycetota bacterium]
MQPGSHLRNDGERLRGINAQVFAQMIDSLRDISRRGDRSRIDVKLATSAIGPIGEKTPAATGDVRGRACIIDQQTSGFRRDLKPEVVVYFCARSTRFGAVVLSDGRRAVRGITAVSRLGHHLRGG